MDKVKITQELAKAIEQIRSNHYHAKNEEIISIHARDPLNWASDVSVMRTFPLDSLIIALYIGYEVEETPEDKVRKLFQSPDHNFSNPDSYRKGIKDTLDQLGIKIEGVNHD